MKGFCPSCGKEMRTIELCEDCKIKIEGIKYKEFKVQECVKCKKIKYKNKWLKKEEANNKIIKEKLGPGWKAIDKKEKEELEKERKKSKNIYIITAKNNKGLYIDLYGTYKKIVCPTCQKKTGNYYEAILQIRGRKALEEMKKVEQSNNKISNIEEEIYKIVEVKNGKDYYFFSSRIAMKIYRDLKKRLRCESKITRKLHSFDRHKSKRIYRLTLLIRC